MIIKSLIILSIALNYFGFDQKSARFDRAVIRNKYGYEQSAQASNEELSLLPQILQRPYLKLNSPKLAIFAHHYLLADMETNKVLLKNAHRDRVPIASTTKIMTAAIVLDEYNLDDVITISEKAAYQPGADAHLRPGEKLTVKSLLKAMLIKSANGAAYALAEHMNGAGEQGIQKFVDEMNHKAGELGMLDTDYHDPAGLDTTGYSSANDLFIVTKYALQSELFGQIVKTTEDSVRSVDGSVWHELKNPNRLVAEYKYPGAIGVKTGYMPEAGHVLVSAATRNGHTFVGVIINTFADTAPASADESRKMLDWGFDNVEWR